MITMMINQIIMITMMIINKIIIKKEKEQEEEEEEEAEERLQLRKTKQIGIILQKINKISKICEIERKEKKKEMMMKKNYTKKEWYREIIPDIILRTK